MPTAHRTAHGSHRSLSLASHWDHQPGFAGEVSDPPQETAPYGDLLPVCLRARPLTASRGARLAPTEALAWRSCSPPVPNLAVSTLVTARFGGPALGVYSDMSRLRPHPAS